jgi:hypothetical protein
LYNRDQKPVNFKKVDAHVHQFKGSSSRWWLHSLCAQVSPHQTRQPYIFYCTSCLSFLIRIYSHTELLDQTLLYLVVVLWSCRMHVNCAVSSVG